MKMPALGRRRSSPRHCASKLHDIAQILGVEVERFFEDASDPARLANIFDSDMPRRMDLLIAQNGGSRRQRQGAFYTFVCDDVTY
jgi:hypothetical protein